MRKIIRHAIERFQWLRKGGFFDANNPYAHLLASLPLSIVLCWVIFGLGWAPMWLYSIALGIWVYTGLLLGFFVIFAPILCAVESRKHKKWIERKRRQKAQGVGIEAADQARPKL